MRISTFHPIVTSFIAFALIACGGSQKPAADATAQNTDTPAADAPKADAEKNSAAAEKKEAKKDDSTDSSTGMPKVVRTAKDKITAPDIVYKFSFKESDVGIKAEKDCTESAKGNGEKMAKCMTAAQKRVVVDDYHFKKDDSSDNWYLLGLRTTGAKVTWTHRMPIEFGKDSETAIVVKITGPDRGQAPYKRPPSEITFEVPNDYQIIQPASEHGKLVFEAKISTLGDGTKAAR